MAAVIAAALGGGAYAFAASLDVKTNTLGAGSAAVTNGCNLDVTYNTTYYPATTYPISGEPDSPVGAFWVTQINVSPDSSSTSGACDNLNYKLDATDSSGASAFEASGTLSSSGDATINASGGSGNANDLVALDPGVLDAYTLGNISAVVESTTYSPSTVGSQP